MAGKAFLFAVIAAAGAGSAYVMLSDSDGDGTPNYAELFGEKPTLPKPYVIVDRDLDGLPDDLEEKWGYSTSEKDVRLKYWVQDPEENKALVDAALEKVVSEYKERNPLKINIHPVYAGEIPAEAKSGTPEWQEFLASANENYHNYASFLIDEYAKPTGSACDCDLEDAYSLRGYFRGEEGNEDIGTGGSGIKTTEFWVLTELGGKHRPIQYLAGDTMHEIGHAMGLDHSPIPESVMYGGTEFFEDEWTILKNEPLLDFRPNPIVAKYVPE